MVNRVVISMLNVYMCNIMVVQKFNNFKQIIHKLFLPIIAYLFIANIALAGEVISASSEKLFKKGPYAVRVERSHLIEMRDGVRLSTDLYFPIDYAGKLPVILERTPYNKAVQRNSDPNAKISYLNKAYYYASHGYVFAIQDRRGKFESEGEYSLGNNDIDDASDTLDWFERQSWYNGRAGMTGCSIPGGNVIRGAMSQHESLKGLLPQSASFGHGTEGGSMGRAGSRGGVPNMFMPLWAHNYGSTLFYRPSKRLDRSQFLKLVDFYDPAPKVKPLSSFFDPETHEMTKETIDVLMHLPAVEIDEILNSPPNEWEGFAASEPLGEFWEKGDYLDDGDSVDGAALHINSWHDHGVNETFLQFKYFSEYAKSNWAKENQYIIIGPMSHCNFESVSSETITGERNVGDASFPAWDTYLRWWDYTLKQKGNSFGGYPRVQYYLPGANEWRQSSEWPIPGTKYTNMYLSSEQGANSIEGDGLLSWSIPIRSGVDEYAYDPGNPVNIYAKAVHKGSSDHSSIEDRKDILVYTSEPLSDSVEMTGKIRAKLWISTDVPDTDVVVRLLDVYPDGRSFGIQESILRLRYRDGPDHSVFMKPGEVYPVDVDMLVGANLFKEGHKIRVHITSSSFPTFMRNLNTGGDNARDTEYKTANIKIHFGPETPSYIQLPTLTVGTNTLEQNNESIE
ncbi:CocE/NonD family hydrolase [Porticoccaceae bacterium LTM1]|nr:CocE/NonD family hydrolase [Porticoccaceae bacterium LTM1]